MAARLILVESSDGRMNLVNLDQVRLVELGDDFCRLIFSPTNTLTIWGQAAEVLIPRLLAEAEMLDGTDVSVITERWGKHKPRIIPMKPGESEDPSR
jgi:hypothetical protein